MKIIGELACSGMAEGGRPPSGEKHDACRYSRYCADAALAMTDMVMSLALEFRRALDSIINQTICSAWVLEICCDIIHNLIQTFFKKGKK